MMSSTLLLCLTIVVGIAAATCQVYAFYMGLPQSEGSSLLWDFIFFAWLAAWLNADHKGRAEIYRPSFDRGFLLYLTWILYLPYYLVRTRGRAGWWWTFGLIGLIFLAPILLWFVEAISVLANG